MTSTLIKLFLLVLLPSTLSACIQPKPGCTALPGGGQYCLQPTSAMQPFEVQQKVEATFKGRHETMITEIEVNPNTFNFVGLTPFGQKLVHISYDNQSVITKTVPDKRLDPTIMLALIQLSLWPAESVRMGLSKPLILEETDNQRSIIADKQVIMQMHYTDNAVPHQALKVTLPTMEMTLEIVSLPEAESSK